MIPTNSTKSAVSDASFSVTDPTSLCRFGIARGDITPPVGIYHRMWGAATHDRAEGVHRPLLATAMVFQSQDPGTSDVQVVIALDHCLFGVPEVEALVHAVTSRTGVAASAIVLLFSHTHGAGLMLLDRVDLPGGDLIPPYLRQVNQVVSELVAQAMESRVPASITYGTTQCELATHRDLWDPHSQQWVCGFNPNHRADQTVLVARVADRQNRTLATIVNYACHPTTLAWDNRLISPDYPGAMRELVERETSAPCVFIQGASGELGPREGFVGDPEVADRNGRQLAFAALSALTGLGPARTHFRYAGPVVSGATLGPWKHETFTEADEASRRVWGIARDNLAIRYRPELPRLDEVEAERAKWLRDEETARRQGNELAARDCRAMVERGTRMLARLRLLPQGPTYPYQLHVWRMGDAIWVAAQGEPYSLLQTELRRRFPQSPIVVCSIANGWGPSYLPPAELYGSGLYQESIAVLEPGSLEQIIEEAARRIQSLLAKS